MTQFQPSFISQTDVLTCVSRILWSTEEFSGTSALSGLFLFFFDENGQSGSSGLDFNFQEAAPVDAEEAASGCHEIHPTNQRNEACV